MSDRPGTIAGAAALLRRGRLTSAALVDDCLARSDALAKELGVYVTRCDDEARRAARRADECLAAGIDLGPLHGIPIAVKDNLVTVDADTTAQSAACRLGQDGRRDAEVVRRLRAGGAVIVGKTSLMEFATALPGEDDPFPVPRNPWDASRWAGGSSSGSAAGVAAGLFPAALGTDTGGSIRNPSAFCGVTGLKPSYGSVPTTGMIPLAPSLDCIGPIARTSRDCGLILAAMAGPAAPSPPASPGRLRGLRIGIDRARMVDVAGAAAGVVGRFDAALGWFAGQGADIVDVDVPLFEELSFIMRLTLDSERLALHRPNLQGGGAPYSASFRDKVRRGVFFSAADYVRAQWVREEGRRQIDRLWERIDVVASPTALYTAPPVATLARDNRPDLQMTAAWSSLGNPALSVPMGSADDGLPVGLQLAGPWGSDHDLLRIGAAFQDGTEWHVARCPSGAGGGA